MRKQRIQWLVVASLVCLAQPAWAASEPIVYQDVLDSVGESYPGELLMPSTPERSNIRIVRRGKQAVTTPSEQLPTRIDADKMMYNGTSGDVAADGNVVVRQGNQTLLANRIEGNTKTTEYRTANGPYRYLEDGGRTKDLTGDVMTYRTSDRHFDAGHTQGWSEPYYVKGQNLTYNGEVGHIEKGMFTTKHAMAFKHTPDFRIEGEDIKIYPGDKMIIKKPSFFIKNFKLLSLPSYTKSLRGDKQGKVSIFSLIPRPTYNSDDGFGLHASTDIPMGKNGEAYIDYRWYSKAGFKPKVGYRYYLPWGTASIGYSKESNEYNDEPVWIEKLGELRIDTHAYHISDTPFTIRGGANIGYWKEGNVKGTHKQYYTEVSHDPLKLWENANIRLFTGYERDYYSYDNSVRSMPYWGGRFSAKVSPRVDAWITYNQRNITYNNSPYLFDTTEIPKELIYGGRLKLSRLDDISVSVKNDINKGEIDSVYYTWHRDLHSFDLYLTYKAHSDNNTWKIQVVGKDF